MLRLTVHAHPGSRQEGIELRADGSLDVRVRAPAVDGRANEAVLRAIGGALGLHRRQVRLIRGERARQKLIEVELSSLDELRRRLAPDSGRAG